MCTTLMFEAEQAVLIRKVSIFQACPKRKAPLYCTHTENRYPFTCLGSSVVFSFSDIYLSYQKMTIIQYDPYFESSFAAPEIAKVERAPKHGEFSVNSC